MSDSSKKTLLGNPNIYRNIARTRPRYGAIIESLVSLAGLHPREVANALVDFTDDPERTAKELEFYRNSSEATKFPRYAALAAASAVDITMLNRLPIDSTLNSHIARTTHSYKTLLQISERRSNQVEAEHAQRVARAIIFAATIVELTKLQEPLEQQATTLIM